MQKTLICPRCKTTFTSNAIKDPSTSVASVSYSGGYQQIFRCINPNCNTYIIAQGQHRDNYYNVVDPKLFPFQPSNFDFSQYPHIKTLSPSFIEYYNQARHCDQLGYKDVAGPGYRKALEFLIKDYATNTNPDDEDKIKKMTLQNCIKIYLENKMVNSISEKAYWVGNDQTHYYVKRENHDLETLKQLIKLAMHHLETDIQSHEMLASFEVPQPTDE